MHGNDMPMWLCIVKLDVVSSTYGDFWEETGWRCTYAQSSPDWDYKGIFVHVLAYACFYKSENFCAYAKSSFCTYVHF